MLACSLQQGSSRGGWGVARAGEVGTPGALGKEQ